MSTVGKLFSWSVFSRVGAGAKQVDVNHGLTSRAERRKSTSCTSVKTDGRADTSQDGDVGMRLGGAVHDTSHILRA